MATSPADLPPGFAYLTLPEGAAPPPGWPLMPDGTPCAGIVVAPPVLMEADSGMEGN